MAGTRFESFSIRFFCNSVVSSFLLLFFMVLSAPFTANGAIPASERAALIALYDNTNGDDWNDNSGWKVEPLDADGFAMPGSENNWYGITINGDSVEEIHLTNNNLTGSISSELSKLTHLNQLDLMANRITGPIPPELGNLLDITSLKLSYNKLIGFIPAELGGLVNLSWLALSGNDLTGSIPSELGNLPNLSFLGLWKNQLTGSIPPELGNLTNLSNLSLGSNQLSGAIPSELGYLVNLTSLSLYSNQLTGPIPSDLGNLINLSSLILRNNQLTGPIPSTLGNLINSESFILAYNQLIGPIPTELGNLIKLTEMQLFNNQLSGNIPSELGYLINLETLDLHNNQLTGPIPNELGNLINLIELKLNDNQLTGTIPAVTGDLVNLIELNLSNNQLSGPIPSELGNLINLKKLFLHNNQLTGTVPPELGNLTELELLTVNANRLALPPNGTVALIVDSRLSSKIDSELQQFKSDLNNEGYTVIEKVVDDIIPPEVRSYLQELYTQTDEDLEGAILIGNIPYAYQWYKRELYNAPPEVYETISYQYYADLDGTFEASPDYVSPGGKEYSFDLHNGDFDWEIWVGVLPYYKGNYEVTVSALKRYFAKNHEYRTCGYVLPEAFLHIGEIYTAETIEEHDALLDRLTDGDIAWTPFSSKPSARIYFDSPPGGLSAEQGFADLSAGVADFTVTHTHGSPLSLGRIDNSWIENNPVKTAFFFSTGCAVGNLDYIDNILTSLLYSPTSEIVVAQGSTNPAPPLQHNAEGFYGHNIASALDSGKNVGQSFLAHVNAPPLVSATLTDWEYLYAPKIILGDPTLTRLTGCEASTDNSGGNSDSSIDGGGGGGCFITMAVSESFMEGREKSMHNFFGLGRVFGTFGYSDLSESEGEKR